MGNGTQLNGTQQAAAGESATSNGASDLASAATDAAEEEGLRTGAGAGEGGGTISTGGRPVNSRMEAFAQV